LSDTAALSAENVEIVRRLHEANARGDDAAALELLDPEIEIEYRGVLIDRDATYHGHAGALQLRDSILETFPDFRIEVEEYIAHGEDVVVALHQRAAGKASGVPIDIRTGHVLTVRNGKAVRWRIYKSKEEALAAVGANA
jgi:ketosteroid isomerase-like protein